MYIANKHNFAQLTHIFVDDGGVFGASLLGAPTPFQFLPAVPAVNDAVYFGIDTTFADTGPFCSLVFDISVIIKDVTTIVWEYWNGAWVALTVQDNTNDDGGMTGVAFDTNLVNSVHWEQESDWATTAVNGVTGYWVRARVTAIGGAPTGPWQQNRDIYSILWPYVEISSSAMLGDITALAQTFLNNQSGGSTTGATLGTDYGILGLRSISRGEDFSSYINLSDEQNNSDITITPDAVDSSFANDVTTPTGRRITYAPGAIRAMADEVDIQISNPLSEEYRGTYRIFLRCLQSGGSAGDIEARLAISATGPGDVRVFYTGTVPTESTTLWNLLDMGQVTMPATNIIDEPEAQYIIIQLSNTNAAASLYLYDLVLIPVDEFAVEFQSHFPDPSLTADSVKYDRYIDINSVTQPKIIIQVSIKNTSDDLVVSLYIPINTSANLLQSNSNQRVWFLNRNQTYPRTPRIEIGHSVQYVASARYLYARGNR